MQTMKNWNQNYQSGFTLIEIMIAITIFAIGLLGINIMQTASITGTSSSRGLSESTSWAGDRIEQIISMNYGLLVDTDLDGTDEDADGDGVDDDGGNFGLDDSNSTTADAQDSTTSATNPILWNVAVNHPMRCTKTVHIIVNNPERGLKQPVILEYIIRAPIGDACFDDPI